MDRLIAFLTRNYNVLLFLGLELIAFSILVKFNKNQHTVFSNAVLGWAANIQRVNARLNAYFQLDEENKKLQQENIRLRKQLLKLDACYQAHLNRQPDTSAFWVDRDTNLRESKFKIIPCKAVSYSTASGYNQVVLNVGRKDGVKKEMGIISTEGVAGIVIAVSEHYSLAMSMLNKKINISARIKGKKIIGTMTWDGEDIRYGSLKFVPQHFHLNRGDSVVTSGYSTFFPDGMMIGWVESVSSKNPDGFHNIKVRLSTDFNKLDYLYLLQFEDQNEIDSLLTKNR
jgi:rod shape-determining protein MreC